MQASSFCGPLCVCELNQTDTNENKLTLFIQPIDNSIFKILFRTKLPSISPLTKFIAHYTEKKHQNYYHN